VNALPLKFWRLLYSLALIPAYPWAHLRLRLRARREPEYAERIAERFGRVPEQIPRQPVWFHAVSAGEAIAAAPLISALAEQHPGQPFLVTATTPAGSAQVQRLLSSRLANVHHCYAPFDFPRALRAFFQTVKPQLLVLVETELWPNLLAEARRAGIGVLLVNGRLSERSFRRYGWIRPLVAEMLGGLRFLACQAPVHAERFLALGARPGALGVLGSMKFDITLPQDHDRRVRELEERWRLENRFVWAAGSTHEGEEAIVLTAHRGLLDEDPHALLILAPRHPARLVEITRLLESRQLHYVTVSSGEPVTAHVQVLVVDTLGDLVTLYGLSAVAFLGGSLVSVGGHNPIEAAITGQPMLIGPETFNFPDVVAAFHDAGALVLVRDSDSLLRRLNCWRNDESSRRAAADAARQVVLDNRGAQSRLMKLLGAELLALSPHSGL
jgi:3-deoxy-D-manno-octulosonic-acid transferase